MCRRSWRQNQTTRMCRWQRWSACGRLGRWDAAWRSTRTSNRGATSVLEWRWSAWRRFTLRRGAWRTPTSSTPSSSRQKLLSIVVLICWQVVTLLFNCCVCVFSLFVEKLPAHRDYQQCSVPEKQLIMKVTTQTWRMHTDTTLLWTLCTSCRYVNLNQSTGVWISGGLGMVAGCVVPGVQGLSPDVRWPAECLHTS